MFDKAATFQGDKLEAQVKHKPYEIGLSDIQRYWVETRTVSTARTVGLVAGVAAAAAVAAIVARATAPTKTVYVNNGMGCCLFVYSWDGERYDFDTEAYTGAITRGLQRDDYSLLTKVREQDGEYRLMRLQRQRRDAVYRPAGDVGGGSGSWHPAARAAADGSLHKRP